MMYGANKMKQEDGSV